MTWFVKNHAQDKHGRNGEEVVRKLLYSGNSIAYFKDNKYKRIAKVCLTDKGYGIGIFNKAGEMLTGFIRYTFDIADIREYFEIQGWVEVISDELNF